MNKVQRNAKAYAKLLDIEYVVYLGYKRHCKRIILRFPKEHFQHLEGISQLTDIKFHQIRSTVIFKMALEGEITEEELKVSKEYETHFVDRKINHLYLLEEFIDNNEIVFNYIKNRTEGSKIQAKIFLYKDMNGQDIYLFLDSTSNDEYYFPRSFVVSPELDYKVGQFKYTVLWKEKRNRKTGESEVLSQFKNFTPDQANA